MQVVYAEKSTDLIAENIYKRTAKNVFKIKTDNVYIRIIDRKIFYERIRLKIWNQESLNFNI